MKTLLIYLPTHNRLPKLQQCVERLVAEVEGVEDRVEIHVSDNGSTDGTAAFVQGLSHPCITHSVNEENLGLPANMLKCHDLADRAEYTWIVGDDDVLLGGAVKQLLHEVEESPAADLLFLNTACYLEDDKPRVMEELAGNGYRFREEDVPRRSKEKRNFDCTHRDLLDPRVDNLFGGSVMCYAWRSSAVTNRIPPDEVTVDFSSPKACYHVAVNYLHCIPPDAPCRHVGDCLTVNFWHGGTDWGVDGYDLAVTQGLGILLYEATRLGFVRDEDWPRYFLSYMRLARRSFAAILDSGADGHRTHLANFHDELSEMLVKDHLLRAEREDARRGGLPRPIRRLFRRS